MSIQITLADSGEIPVVHRIMRQSFEEYRNKLFPPSGALNEEIKDIYAKTKDNGGAVIVWKDETPVGSAQYFFQDHYMYIGRVSVVPDARGLGLGKQIMLFLEDKARDSSYTETRIEVRLSIPQNIAFYSKLLYEVIEEHEYAGGTDRWVIMKKSL